MEYRVSQCRDSAGVRLSVGLISGGILSLPGEMEKYRIFRMKSVGWPEGKQLRAQKNCRPGGKKEEGSPQNTSLPHRTAKMSFTLSTFANVFNGLDIPGDPKKVAEFLRSGRGKMAILPGLRDDFYFYPGRKSTIPNKSNISSIMGALARLRAWKRSTRNGRFLPVFV